MPGTRLRHHAPGAGAPPAERCATVGRARLTGRLAALLLAFGPLLAATPASADPDCKSAPAPQTDWRDCNKSNIVLQGGDLTEANLAGADFSATDLRGAILTGASLEKATLVRSSLAGATAEATNFSRISAYRTSFAGIGADDASFAGAELQRADFSGASLQRANFEKAEAGRANFEDAVLTGSRFTLANLSRADLRKARFEGPLDFQNAYLFLTRIEGVDLSEATGLAQSQIELACGDAATRLPADLTTPQGWPCTFD